MKQSQILVNSVLWATAIVASAILGAPAFLTILLLPGLSAISMFVSLPGGSRCGSTRD